MNAFSLTAPSSIDRGNALAFESANQINLLLERGGLPEICEIDWFYDHWQPEVARSITVLGCLPWMGCIPLQIAGRP